ncbi:MAG: ribonuclease E/G, partial [Aeromicrobium sp.]
MLDENETPTETTTADPAKDVPTVRRRAAGRPAGPPAAVSFSAPVAPVRAAPAQLPLEDETDEDDAPVADAPPAKKAPARRARKPKAAVTDESTTDEAADPASADEPVAAPVAPPAVAMFKAPEPGLAPPRAKQVAPVEPAAEAEGDDDTDDEDDPDAPRRRRRSRGGRRRRKGESDTDESSETDGDEDDTEDDGNGGTRRRRRRARAGEGADVQPDDPENTVVRVRSGRSAEDEITGVAGSTRLEAKKQRRREGREAGRRRAPIVSEAEFLARRESVQREMVVRQRDDYTQIAVIEDNVLVEHYVARESQVSIIGNVYLGKVQNV